MAVGALLLLSAVCEDEMFPRHRACSCECVNVCQTLKFTNESHKDEQRSRKLTPGGSAHVTTECESVCDF